MRRQGTTVRRARSTAEPARRGTRERIWTAVLVGQLLDCRWGGCVRWRAAARRRPGFCSISPASAFTEPRVTSRRAGSWPSGTNGEVLGHVAGGGRGECLLDQPVLQRVVGLDDDAASDADRVDGGGDPRRSTARLVVDLHPQRLEGALGRMPTGAPRGAGISAYSRPTWQADVVNGAFSRSRTTAAAILRANFSSPYSRRIRVRSAAGTW